MTTETLEAIEVPTADLVFDDKYQMRVDVPSVDSYVELINASAFWPFDRPITVFRIRGKLKVVDGFTRGRAACVAKLAKVQVIIMPGGHKEAMQHAFGCNAEHGFRRTNADKNKAVLKAIAEYENTDVSVAQIALLCKVSRQYVNTLVNRLKGAKETADADQDRDLSELGNCPVCQVNNWTEASDGISCAACRQRHGEPVGGDQETIDPPSKAVLKKVKPGTAPATQPASSTKQKPADAVNKTKALAEQASTAIGQLVRCLDELGDLDALRPHLEAIQKQVNKRKRSR